MTARWQQQGINRSITTLFFGGKWNEGNSKKIEPNIKSYSFGNCKLISVAKWKFDIKFTKNHFWWISNMYVGSFKVRMKTSFVTSKDIFNVITSCHCMIKKPFKNAGRKRKKKRFTRGRATYYLWYDDRASFIGQFVPWIMITSYVV